MDTRELDIFVKLTEVGTVTRAALALDLTQSTVSRALSALESQCGGPLFFRNGRGVVLTPLGKCLLPHAKAMLTDFERLQRDSEAMAGVPTGTVRVGIMPALVPLIVTDLFARVAERFPRVLLSVAEGYSGQLNEMLTDGTLDVAILFDYGRACRIGREFLAPVDSWLVGGPGVFKSTDTPMTFEAMARLPLAMPPMSNSLRVAMSRQAERCGVELNVVVEINSFIPLTEMLAQGRCVSVLPYFAVAQKLAKGELTGRPIAEPLIVRSMMLATSSFMPASLASREVSRVLRSLVLEAHDKMPLPLPLTAIS